MKRRWCCSAIALFWASAAAAKPPIPVRPVPSVNRWQEDWSVLADPRVKREPLDWLKYIPLLESNPKSFLSLGANQRTRYEINDAPGFGLTGRADAYLLTRTEVHADLRSGPVQAFVQLANDLASGKKLIGPADQDRLDVEQAFVALVLPLGRNVLKLRAGRQQMAWDRQRFITIRNGPNVRQSFDALWGDYETGTWRVIGFAAHPVTTRDTALFDDRSGQGWTFSGLRVERKVLGGNELSSYWARWTRADVRFGTVTGNERRDILDIRFAGTRGGLDWDAEVMAQSGSFAGRRIRAGYVGTILGYSFASPLKPRLGIQIDLASGDRHSSDNRLGTFNPLFAGGTYVTLAGYTGLSNLVHVRPSIIIHPSRDLQLSLAAAGQWRMTAHDTVYLQPLIPLRGLAGRPGKWTGDYVQLRGDLRAGSHWSFAAEGLAFQVGGSVAAAGGRNSRYLGIESSFEF